MTRYKPPINVAEPPLLADAEIYALKALSQGVASKGQQQMALTTIVMKFCGAYDLSYRSGPAGDRDTVFAEGKRFVGQRILEATTRPMKVQGGKEDATRPERERERSNPKPESGRSKPE